MYMARTGHVALITSQVLSTNAMVLVKAWMFAAGLLLGFSMFAAATTTPHQPVPEIDAAFQNALKVMEHLAKASPQARHYCEILDSFFDAIVQRREQVRCEKISGKNGERRKYVEQLFTAEVEDEAGPSSVLGSGGSEEGVGGIGNGSTAYETPVSTTTNTFQNQYLGNGASQQHLHTINENSASGLDAMMGFDFNNNAVTALNASSASQNLTHTAEGYLLPWEDTMGILNDNLHVDWDTLWPLGMDGMGI